MWMMLLAMKTRTAETRMGSQSAPSETILPPDVRGPR
jgi:hypothetical protein